MLTSFQCKEGINERVIILNKTGHEISFILYPEPLSIYARPGYFMEINRRLAVNEHVSGDTVQDMSVTLFPGAGLILYKNDYCDEGALTDGLSSMKTIYNYFDTIMVNSHTLTRDFYSVNNWKHYTRYGDANDEIFSYRFIFDISRGDLQ